MKIIEDDLFSGKYGWQAIFHQCNCFCTMGAGFAKQIANRYPQAVRADMMTTVGDKKKMGTFSKAFITPETVAMPKLVYNLYSQYRYGRSGCQTDYQALKKAFESACDDLILIYDYHRKIFPSFFDTPIFVAIPYLIGCGLAGGDEFTVTGIIDEIVDKRKTKIAVRAFRRIEK